MGRVSALVITKNEERYLEDCLKGLVWADEIVVLDSNSTDRTVDIARKYTQKVFQHEFVSFPRARNTAIDLAESDWGLFLDADERTTPELVAEIQRVVADKENPYAGYWIPRKNCILGRWMKHTGWYPDHQLRLLRRSLARFDEQFSPHEVADLKGPASYLLNHITHYNYESLAQFFLKQARYSSQEAEFLYKRGIRAKPQNFILQPMREFHRRYIGWEGYKDGLHGLLLSFFMAYYNFVTYVKLSRIK